MAVNVNWKVRYQPVRVTGNGSSTNYSPAFPVLEVPHLRVYRNGVDITGTGYTVSLASRGVVPTITFTTAPPSTDTIFVTLENVPTNAAVRNLSATAYNSTAVEELHEIENCAIAVGDFHALNGAGSILSASPYKYIQRIVINPAASSTTRLGDLNFTNRTVNGRTRRVPTIASDDYIINLIPKTNSLGDVDAGKPFVTSFSGDMLGRINQLTTAYFWFEFTHHFSDVSSDPNQTNYRVIATTSILNEIFNVNLNSFNSDPILPFGTPNLDRVAPISARLIVQVGNPQDLFAPPLPSAPGAEMVALSFENCAVNFTQLSDKRGPRGATGPAGPVGPSGSTGAVNHDTTLSGTGAADDVLRVTIPFTQPEKNKLQSVAVNATDGATTLQANAIAANTAKIGLSTGSVTTDFIGTGQVTTTKIAQQNITSNLLATNAVGLRALGTANAGSQGQILARGGGEEIEWIAAPSGGGGGGLATVISDSSLTGTGASSAPLGLAQTVIDLIAANTAKTGITQAQANAITANTAKTGITASQASAITANTAKTRVFAANTGASDPRLDTIPTGSLMFIISNENVTFGSNSYNFVEGQIWEKFGTGTSAHWSNTELDTRQYFRGDWVNTGGYHRFSVVRHANKMWLLQNDVGANAEPGVNTNWLELGGSGGLSAIATFSSLTGNGTAGSPLDVANPFTEADETKLDGIETAATADQTPAELVTALGTLTGSARLDASAIQNLPQPGDGGLSSVATDGTLTGLGTNADTLKVANPFTDADETKLDGIATGATVGASTSQASAIALNTAKVGLTDASVTTARIADNAVTLAKINAGTSTAGQVLSATSTGLDWIDAGSGGGGTPGSSTEGFNGSIFNNTTTTLAAGNFDTTDYDFLEVHCVGERNPQVFSKARIMGATGTDRLEAGLIGTGKVLIFQRTTATTFQVYEASIASSNPEGETNSWILTFIKFGGGTGPAGPPGTPGSGGLTPEQTAEIAANTAKVGLTAGSVGTDELANSAVTAAKIATGTITATQMAANSVGNSEIIGVSADFFDSARAVTADKIRNNAVTGAKIANDAITPEHIDGTPSVGQVYRATSATRATWQDLPATGATPQQAAAIALNTAKVGLTDGSITTARIANDAVTTEKIANNAITPEQIDGTPIAGQVYTATSPTRATWQTPSSGTPANGSIGTAQLADNAVTTAKIGNQQVTNSKLSSGSAAAGTVLTVSEIPGVPVWQAPTSGTPANGSIGTDQLADMSVTSAKIADLSISSAKYGIGSVDSIILGSNSVTTPKIASGAVTLGKMASNSIGTQQILDNSIIETKLNASNTPVGGQVLTYHTNQNVASFIWTTPASGGTPGAGSIGTTELADDAVTQAKLADNINQSAFQFVAAVSGSFTGFANGTGTAFGTVEGQLAGVVSIYHGSATSSLTQVRNRIGITFSNATEAAKYNAIQIDGTTFQIQDAGIPNMPMVKISTTTSVDDDTLAAFVSGQRYFIRMRLAAGSHLIGGRGVVVDGITLVGEGTPEAPFQVVGFLGFRFPPLPTS